MWTSLKRFLPEGCLLYLGQGYRSARLSHLFRRHIFLRGWLLVSSDPVKPHLDILNRYSKNFGTLLKAEFHNIEKDQNHSKGISLPLHL